MTASPPAPPPSDPQTTPASRQKQVAVVVGVLVVLGLLAVLAFVLNDDDDEPVTTGSTTTSTTQSSTTEAPTTDTTATTPTSGSPSTGATDSTPAPDMSSAVFPTESMSVRYDDPVTVAERFATFVGFSAPLVGEFQQGDSRSGEVEVRPAANGPVTTVLVRQLGTDGSWSVIGATTAGIQVSEPGPGAEISSPVALRGTSTAFEGTVGTEIQDDSVGTLGEGFVTGGANGEMGPFESELAFSAPTTDSGAVLLTTESMEDGGVWEAAVVRVHFQR